MHILIKSQAVITKYGMPAWNDIDVKTIIFMNEKWKAITWKNSIF